MLAEGGQQKDKGGRRKAGGGAGQQGKEKGRRMSRGGEGSRRSRVPVIAAISSTVFAPEGRGKRPAT